MVQWNAGLGGGVDASAPEHSVPGAWVTTADDHRHFIAGLQAGVPGAFQGRATTIQAGASLKIATCEWFWNGGRRMQRQSQQPVSLYSLLVGTQTTSSSESISTAPSGTRFAVTGTALAQFRKPSNTNSIRLERPQAVQLRAAPALVREVPLPLALHPSGAAWLKLKAVSPAVGGLIDSDGMWTQADFQLQKGTVSAELVTDACVDGDYSRMAIGVRAPYRARHVTRGSVRPTLETPEFYAKLQHNKQRFSASWHERNGLRLSMSHMF